MEVLLARCRVLLRRDAREKSRYIHIDDLEVDTVNHTVKRGGIDLQLTQREFGVFEALLLREGTVISREQLRLRVWNDDAAVGSNVVDVYVKQLRSKLEETPARASGAQLGLQRETVSVARCATTVAI